LAAIKPIFYLALLFKPRSLNHLYDKYGVPIHNKNFRAHGFSMVSVVESICSKENIIFILPKAKQRVEFRNFYRDLFKNA